MEEIEGLMARGTECRVVMPTLGPAVAELESRGVQCHICHFDRWVRDELPPHGLRKLKNRIRVLVVARRQWAEGQRIAGLLSSWKPDVVVTNTICMAVGAVAAWRLGSAHVWHIHEFGMLDWGLRFMLGQRLSVSLMSRYSNAVIFNSRAVAQYFSDGIPAAKQWVIPYRMKPPAEPTEGVVIAPRHDGSLNCVIVGEVAPHKRQEDAIAAVGQLARAGLDVRLSIVGRQNAEYREVLDHLIDEYGIRDRVELVNWVRDPGPYVRAADVALMCSQMEAFGRVTVEAMQLGRPVIGARSGGTTELIRDGETGMLFEVANPTDLAHKIRQLCEHRELVSSLGAAARAWTHDVFTEEATIGKIYELLCGCAAKGSGSASWLAEYPAAMASDRSRH
jgi:glycosyltransferase involved in cell wall biosynthesis